MGVMGPSWFYVRRTYLFGRWYSWWRKPDGKHSLQPDWQIGEWLSGQEM